MELLAHAGVAHLPNLDVTSVTQVSGHWESSIEQWFRIRDFDDEEVCDPSPHLLAKYTHLTNLATSFPFSPSVDQKS